MLMDSDFAPVERLAGLLFVEIVESSRGVEDKVRGLQDRPSGGAGLGRRDLKSGLDQ